MPRTKTNKISLYKLLKNSEFDVFSPKSGYTVESEDKQHRLFIEFGRSRSPHWRNYLSPILTGSKNKIVNRSCSFVLLYKFRGDVYALTGGYGHTALVGLVEEDFGLQLAVRMIEDDSDIAALTQRALKGTTRHSIRSVAGYDPHLDRQNYNRILKSIRGKGLFEGRKFQISGSSSLSLRTEGDIAKLDDLLKEICTINRRKPKIEFPKSYKLVTGRSLVMKLENQLVAELGAYWVGAKSRDDFYLEYKEPAVQFRSERYRITTGNVDVSVEDFDLDRIREKLCEAGASPPGGIEDLHLIRVTAINEDGHEEFRDVSLSSLLVHETTMDDGVHYLRLDGRWYAILDEVRQYLDDQVKRISMIDLGLPVWRRDKHAEEKDYNLYAASMRGFQCLDRDKVKVKGRSNVELCDLFDSKERRFIHVKSGWGSKLAYLFSQGLVAGESYESSQEFRNECKKKWPSQFSRRVGDAEIVFAIADGNARGEDFPQNLTYFAKVCLCEAAASLRSLGYKISLAPIDYVPLAK